MLIHFWQFFNRWTGPFAPVEPFPGCAAALKCVQEQFCDINGVMVNQPVTLTEFERTFIRPPLMVIFLYFLIAQ